VADEESPVGSVAEEAARLLDALGGWAARAGYAAEPGRRHTAEPGTRHTADSADGATAQAETGHPAAHPSGHCEKCGAADGAGQAVVCRLCPVCQGIGLLRSVRPETVDRLADLAGAIAATLRDVADQRRHDAPDGAPGQGRSRPRVQDIPVEDEASS
jgi:hypothetical protein